MSAETVVRIQGIDKSFPGGITALENFSAILAKSTVTGLIGPDGAGKTTLMRLLAGLLEPDRGRIEVFGLDVGNESTRVQTQLGYMPQRFGLYEDLTVQENLDLYADLQGLASEYREERYQTLLNMTGLAPFTTRLAGHLSGGMKQKLGLACVLVGHPRLLLLDEPTVGVDPVSRRELWRIVYSQVQSTGLTVLLSTAYLEEAEHCQEVILIHRGHPMGQGPPDKFRRHMRGRVYQVRVPGLPRRRLQRDLASLPEIIDSVIQGEGVRIITHAPAYPNLRRQDPIDIAPATPRLEDYFIATLAKKTHPPPRCELTLPGRPTTKQEGKPVIVVENLKRRFGSFFAVKGVSFEVMRGEVFGLLGANGAGKTTTFRMLCGLLPVSEGNAQVAGVDMRRAPARARARIGYMAQKFSLYGQLSVRENLTFFSGIYDLKRRERKQRLEWALSTFELTPFVSQRAVNLPLGYKQRLAMACALLHQPEVLFLDEPTSGVDPLARREFWQRINALAEQGVTVLVTTHFMEEAEYCDRLVIMQAGSILAVGTPVGIRRHAATPDNPNPTLEDAFIRLIDAST